MTKTLSNVGRGCQRRLQSPVGLVLGVHLKAGSQVTNSSIQPVQGSFCGLQIGQGTIYEVAGIVEFEEGLIRSAQRLQGRKLVANDTAHIN